jgi:hypothetical protein
MSSSQRVRKSSPCSKQGPMRATLPVSSLLRQGRQGSSLRKSNSNSPTVSPTNAAAWRARISPETSSSSGQRSPGSLSYKGTSPAFLLPASPSFPLLATGLFFVLVESRWRSVCTTRVRDPLGPRTIARGS